MTTEAFITQFCRCIFTAECGQMESLAKFRHFALQALFPVSKVTKVPKKVECALWLFL